MGLFTRKSAEEKEELAAEKLSKQIERAQSARRKSADRLSKLAGQRFPKAHPEALGNAKTVAEADDARLKELLAKQERMN